MSAGFTLSVRMSMSDRPSVRSPSVYTFLSLRGRGGGRGRRYDKHCSSAFFVPSVKALDTVFYKNTLFYFSTKVNVAGSY